jgi:hypothetical protein
MSGGAHCPLSYQLAFLISFVILFLLKFYGLLLLGENSLLLCRCLAVVVAFIQSRSSAWFGCDSTKLASAQVRECFGVRVVIRCLSNDEAALISSSDSPRNRGVYNCTLHAALVSLVCSLYADHARCLVEWHKSPGGFGLNKVTLLFLVFDNKCRYCRFM